MAERLLDYVGRLKKNGFSSSSIRAHLARAGFDEKEIARVVGGGSNNDVKSSKHMSYLLGGGCVALAIIITIFLFFFLSGEEKKVSVKIIPKGEAVIFAGEYVVFEKQIFVSGKKVPVEVIIKLVDGAKLIVEKKERLLVSEVSKSQSRLLVPVETIEGKYTLKVQGQSVDVKSFDEFEVIIGSKKVKQKEVADQNSISSNDLCEIDCSTAQACMNGFCREGVCAVEHVVPCCGNAVCRVRPILGYFPLFSAEQQV